MRPHQFDRERLQVAACSLLQIELARTNTTSVNKSENTQPGRTVDIELGFWFGSALSGLTALQGIITNVALL